MSKDHAKHLTDEQIDAEVAGMRQEIRAGKISADETERDAYFSDPANTEETDVMFERMELVEAMYKACHEAGLTQKQHAEKLGTNQNFN